MLQNEKIKKALKDDLLLLVHHHADVDSVASAIALKTIFSDATICASDGISVSGQNIAKITADDILPKPPTEWDGTVIALDSPNPAHCGPVPKAKQGRGQYCCIYRSRTICSRRSGSRNAWS